MPVSTFRQPQLLKPEGFNVISKNHFAAPKPVKRIRKRVTFKPSVNVRPILHVNDYTEDEIKSVWFCRSDFDAMKKGFARTVKLISHNVYRGDDDDHCARGLEYRVRAGALKRRENKLNGLEAVLEEQESQAQLGINDDESISRAFVRENLHCRLAALQVGIRDEEVAIAIHNEQLTNNTLQDESYSSDKEMDYCDM